MVTNIPIIDLLLSYADDLSRACHGIVDLLSLVLWTTQSGFDVTLGSLIFGIGFPFYVGIAMAKWIGDILPG